MSFIFAYNFYLDRGTQTFTADADIAVDAYIDPETFEYFPEFQWDVSYDGMAVNSGISTSDYETFSMIFNEAVSTGSHALYISAFNWFGGGDYVEWNGDLQNMSLAEFGQTINAIDETPGSNHVDIVFGSEYADEANLGQNDDFIDAGGGDDKINAGSGNDTVLGGEGNDRLDGGTGVDILRGGQGNDTYFVDNAADVVEEAVGQGTDTVYTRVSYVLGANQSVEWLRTISQGATTAINLTGNNLSQTILGNAGVNQISDGGGAGADILAGMGGNDSYFVRNAGTTIVENASGGTNDTVAAAVSYALGTGVYVERLATISASATTAINLTGNEIGQTIVGNKGINILSGKGGNDLLAGGTGKDTFVFDTAPNSNSNHDKINDFSSIDDTIQLAKSVFGAIAGIGTLTANQFHSSSTGLAHDLDDRIIYNTTTGVITYDQNGSNPGGAIQFATLVNHPTIGASDFFLV